MESDPLQINFRYGGDVKGLIRRLDYIQGMGFKAIYIAGTIFVRPPPLAPRPSCLELRMLGKGLACVRLSMRGR